MSYLFAAMPVFASDRCDPAALLTLVVSRETLRACSPRSVSRETPNLNSQRNLLRRPSICPVSVGVRRDRTWFVARDSVETRGEYGTASARPLGQSARAPLAPPDGSRETPFAWEVRYAPTTRPPRMRGRRLPLVLRETYSESRASLPPRGEVGAERRRSQLPSGLCDTCGGTTTPTPYTFHIKHSLARST